MKARRCELSVSGSSLKIIANISVIIASDSSADATCHNSGLPRTEDAVSHLLRAARTELTINDTSSKKPVPTTAVKESRRAWMKCKTTLPLRGVASTFQTTLSAFCS